MSMVMCKDCDRIFDSDADPDCFVDVGNMRRMTFTEIVCQPCRWVREEEQEAYAAYVGQAEYEAEQNSGAPPVEGATLEGGDHA